MILGLTILMREIKTHYHIGAYRFSSNVEIVIEYKKSKKYEIEENLLC